MEIYKDINILFVNNFYNLFAKADCGASQRSMNLIRALAKIGHVDVVSFVVDTVSNETNVDVVYFQNIGLANKKDSRYEKFLKLFRWNNPYAIYPENKEKSEIIDKLCKKNQYDFIVTRYLHFACDCGLLKYKDRLIIDIDDDPKDVVLMSMDKIKTLRNRLYNHLFANTVDKVTRYAVGSIYMAFYSTPNKRYPNAQFLPNISAYSKTLCYADFSCSERRIMIVGRFQYIPNAEGLEHFLRRIFPLVKKIMPMTLLRVVGDVADKDLRQLCENTEGVELLGFVEDLQAAYSDCHCAVVPLYRGTGTSVKMIEAMTVGRAVVTTSIGARGLHPRFIPNMDYILADDDYAFAEGIVSLLSNEKRNRQITKNANDKARKYYSVESFNSIIAKAIR